MALIPALWGPRLISRDHRMHVYSDPRDQCSLNIQKLNNKSLTSIHIVLHKVWPLWSSLSITSQRKSLSITWTHAICLNPTGILTGKRPSSHVRRQRNLHLTPVLSCLADKITSGKPMSTLNVLASNPRVITEQLCKALLLIWHFCGKLVFLMQLWSTFIKDMNASATSIRRLQTSTSRESYEQLMLKLIVTSSRIASIDLPNRVVCQKHMDVV